MIQRTTLPELIAPQEAAALSAKFGTTDDIFRAEEIYNEFLKLKGAENDTRWKFLCAISTIYIAGRIQGIREERRKKRDKS